MIATVAARVPWLIVDLTGLKFIDCAGTRALAAAARQARQAGGGLVLAAPAPLVRRMFDLTGLMTDAAAHVAGTHGVRTAGPSRPGAGGPARAAASPRA